MAGNPGGVKPVSAKTARWLLGEVGSEAPTLAEDTIRNILPPPAHHTKRRTVTTLRGHTHILDTKALFLSIHRDWRPWFASRRTSAATRSACTRVKEGGTDPGILVGTGTIAGDERSGAPVDERPEAPARPPSLLSRTPSRQLEALGMPLRREETPKSGATCEGSAYTGGASPFFGVWSTARGAKQPLARAKAASAREKKEGNAP